MADVDLLGISKQFADETEAVSDLDLHVEDGEFLILVGPSGCGKSTVLRMIAGLEEVTSGELRIGGELVNDKPSKDRDVAMVFQSYALYPHMTVRDNMGFALKVARADKAEIRSRIETASAMLGLDEFLDRKPGQLSGGQRQRVAMGRAIVREPKAFLMDEPLSNLDAKLRVQIRAQIALLQQRLGVTTVYVTHDQTEAMTLGDRVAVMRGGVLQQLGSPMELYERPANLFVAGFIGSPSMNLMPAAIADGKLRLPLGDVDLPPGLELNGKPRRLIAGIRPESFGDAGTGGPGVEFRTRIDVLESLGSELYAYFQPPAGGPGSTWEVAGEGDTGLSARYVARLETESPAREGEVAALALDPERIHLFDAASGERLSAGARAAEPVPVAH